MTTRHSSLHPGSPNESTNLVDGGGRRILLGDEVGSGGEGKVLQVANQPDIVVKLYHKLPLADNTVRKLEAMIACSSSDIVRVSAWPRGLVYDARSRQPRGLLMPHIRNARRLHELYGTTTRRRHFPESYWHHLVLAARNLAAAFDAMHANRIVVGDVNQGNLLVDPQMCVRFIDCDSFQIEAGETIYYCPVGTPHFTPPELQSKRLALERRTSDHDGFGLAVLIFHLLFVGRHPFAGRYAGNRDVPIERAIADRLFAFSQHVPSDLVEPPPCSLALDDIPRPLGDLFERAFRGPSTVGHPPVRPQAREWVPELEALLKQRKECDLDASHYFYGRLAACPWCRIETEGGPSYFVAFGDEFWHEDTTDLERAVDPAYSAPFPEIQATRFQVPRWQQPLPKGLVRARSATDLATILLLLAPLLALTGIYSPWLLVAAATLTCGAASFLLIHPASRQLRRQAAEFRTQLTHVERQQRGIFQRTVAEHRTRAAQYQAASAKLDEQIRHFHAEGDELRQLVAQFETEGRDRQRHEYLTKFLIRDHLSAIPGMTAQTATMLAMYGVDSAAEADMHMLYGIPNVSENLAMELVRWRKSLQGRFVFRPDIGTSLKDLEQDQEEAKRNYRHAQARKALIRAKELRAMSIAASRELEKSHAAFDELRDQMHNLARQFLERQAVRRATERQVNRSIGSILALALGIISFIYAIYLVWHQPY